MQRPSGSQWDSWLLGDLLDDALELEGDDGSSSDGRSSQGTGGIIETMTLTLRAHVANGRLVVDESVDLPDGTEVHVAVVDGGDQLDEEDRARLHAAIE